jgi:competence protein ComEA
MKTSLQNLSAISIIILSIFLTNCSQPTYLQIEIADGPSHADAIDINSADAEELSKLPGIGETLAQRMIKFREENGPFRKREHLMLVDGISEKRYRGLRQYVRVE